MRDYHTLHPRHRPAHPMRWERRARIIAIILIAAALIAGTVKGVRHLMPATPATASQD